MILTIIILSIVIILLGYTTYNLMQKCETLEDIAIDSQNQYKALASSIVELQAIMKKADSKGSFESDDEIGIAFTTIKDAVKRVEQNI